MAKRKVVVTGAAGYVAGRMLPAFWEDLVTQRFPIGLIVLFLVLSCHFSDSSQNPANVAPLQSATAVQSSNPFGLMLYQQDLRSY